MSRTTLFAATTAVATALAAYLFVDNRNLRAKLARPAAIATSSPSMAAKGDPWQNAVNSGSEPRPAPAATGSVGSPNVTPPSLPSAESRMDRRARRTEEFAAMFGRGDDESEADYKARITPLIKMGLEGPRKSVEAMREQAEKQAGVTAEQHAQIDEALAKSYDEVLKYTNEAIADRQLSPYERNVSGWLEYAGGLGGILGNAQSRVGSILTPAQMQTMYGSGFEWGEYLGVKAPWEELQAPPTKPK